jgi:hypothetical protein
MGTIKESLNIGNQKLSKGLIAVINSNKKGSKNKVFDPLHLYLKM